jgi:hypothetical protein
MKKGGEEEEEGEEKERGKKDTSLFRLWVGSRRRGSPLVPYHPLRFPSQIPVLPHFLWLAIDPKGR